MPSPAAPETPPPSGFALFAYGFRPFFLLTGLYGAVSPLIWAVAYLWGLPFPDIIAPSLWHAHEMVFGFAVAAACGFLLTVVPSWTGTPPLQGKPLMALAALWLAGRLVFWFGGAMPAAATAVIDLAMLPGLMVAVATPIVRSGRARNLPVVAMLGVILIANGLFHAEALGLTGDTAALGVRLGVYAFIVLIAIISGRITPMFTANVLRMTAPDAVVSTPKHAQPIAFAAVLAAAAAHLAEAPDTVTGGLALAAALALSWRMSRWQTARTLRLPILWILHTANLWVIAGFACLAGSKLAGWPTEDAALHALTAGAMGSAILAVMTRAGLGHTGRPIDPPKPVAAAYFLITGAALVRVFGVATGEYYLPFVLGSAVLWALAYALFTMVYVSVLTRPRADGRPG